MADNDAPTLRRLEESLWERSTRFDRSYMEVVLADDFFEIGRSGRVWTRQEVITTQAHDIVVELPLADFVIHMISNDVALVTYRTVVPGKASEGDNRASLWRRSGGRWQLVFHQGTPTSP